VKKIFIFFLAGLIIFFGFIARSTAQQQTDEEQRDRQNLEQQKLELQQDQQQLEQQRLYQQQLAQQQQIEQQLAQQQLYQQELAQQSEVVIEPDLYLFGGDYSSGRYAYNYSHRGYESRGEAHSGGERRGRR
jgi:Ni/Co efflux regulator RcnB